MRLGKVHAAPSGSEFRRRDSIRLDKIIELALFEADEGMPDPMIVFPNHIVAQRRAASRRVRGGERSLEARV